MLSQIDPLAVKKRGAYDGTSMFNRGLDVNPFADMEEDTVIVERGGREVGRHSCCFTQPRLTIIGNDVDVVEGDKIFQLLPNGSRVEFDVEDVNYQSGLGGMDGCFAIELAKVRAKPKSATGTTTNHITIHGSTGIQIGDHNVQNLQVAMKEVLAAIESAHASLREKEEAKGLLSKFLEHPLVSAAVGAGLPAALGLVG
ncbi:hypothetical protein DN387_00185 [Pseudomonas sp. FBF18]|jgi:hypothetical protein|uniref:RIP homotypic interaction motif-containing protein n=1 Tax=Pseudomonas TaxID=286 RepID=UPI0006D48D6A|nr:MULTISPECIES: RIP homotypic interaction motif-containing protein [Pseudomonas]MCP8346654.1 hypothetical protein [Pseudomonas sp. FBF18]